MVNHSSGKHFHCQFRGRAFQPIFQMRTSLGETPRDTDSGHERPNCRWCSSAVISLCKRRKEKIHNTEESRNKCCELCNLDFHIEKTEKTQSIGRFIALVIPTWRLPRHHNPVSLPFWMTQSPTPPSQGRI